MYKIILAVAAFVICNGTVQARDTAGKKNVTYLDAVRFENREIAKDGREVCLNMDIILDSAKIRTQHTVSLTPVLVSADGKQEKAFETVIVDGKTRHKVFLRREALDQTDSARYSAQAIIKRKNRTEQEYAYVSAVPYSPWMLDGKVTVRECVQGCADCGEGTSETVLESPVLPKFIPQWATGKIEPAPEPVKRREESRIARLHFRWDRYDILPSWKDNSTVLDTVTRSIALVKDKDYISITGIYVAGFASPEGTWDYNIRLSRNRAQSFARYIAGHNDVADSLIHVEWSGEDWDGFRARIEDSDFAKKDRIIDVIDTFTEDRNLCERKMMRLLTRSEYVWLLRNIYPYLRHCTYRVEYEVKNFDLGEARRMIYERPQDLNLSEMYKVAGSYSPDSEEYAHAMAMAAKYYPHSPAVMSDTAAAAIARGDAASAVEILSEAASLMTEEAMDRGLTGEQAELLNLYGTACAQAGQYDTATAALEAAAKAGNANAEHNMSQLLNVISQL